MIKKSGLKLDWRQNEKVVLMKKWEDFIMWWNYKCWMEVVLVEHPKWIGNWGCHWHCVCVDGGFASGLRLWLMLCFCLWMEVVLLEWGYHWHCACGWRLSLTLCLCLWMEVKLVDCPLWIVDWVCDWCCASGLRLSLTLCLWMVVVLVHWGCDWFLCLCIDIVFWIEVVIDIVCLWMEVVLVHWGCDWSCACASACGLRLWLTWCLYSWMEVVLLVWDCCRLRLSLTLSLCLWMEVVLVDHPLWIVDWGCDWCCASELRLWLMLWLCLCLWIEIVIDIVLVVVDGGCACASLIMNFGLSLWLWIVDWGCDWCCVSGWSIINCRLRSLWIEVVIEVVLLLVDGLTVEIVIDIALVVVDGGCACASSIMNFGLRLWLWIVDWGCDWCCVSGWSTMNCRLRSLWIEVVIEVVLLLVDCDWCCGCACGLRLWLTLYFWLWMEVVLVDHPSWIVDWSCNCELWIEVVLVVVFVDHLNESQDFWYLELTVEARLLWFHHIIKSEIIHTVTWNVRPDIIMWWTYECW